MSHWMIDLRKTAVKKWAKYASDVTLVLFSKNKKKLKQARQLPSAEVCDVSGKKYGKTMLKHIKAYVRNHPEATLWVFTRNKKLRKRCQKWQARHPEVQLWVLKKLPSELPVEAETVEVETSVVEAETAVVAEAQVDNEMPTVEAETPVLEANDVEVEIAVAAEAQVDSETTAAEAPVVEANEVETETSVVEANEVEAETAVAEEVQVDNETPTTEVETPVAEEVQVDNETLTVEAETSVAEEVQVDNETPTAEADTPVVEANEVGAETAVVEETPTLEHEETLVFTMETEVFAETVPINPAVLEAQAVIKKNKPKKKQHLIHLLAQTLHLETVVAQDLVQQLQVAGNISIDAAENIKYCS